MNSQSRHASNGRIAVVTGGNKGIGFEICRQLARRAVNVVLTARDARRGRDAERRLQDEGLNVLFHPLDVTDAAQVDALRETMQREHGRCDILVNNAGVLLDARGSRVLDAQVETFRETFETNVYGPLRLCQALVPLMRRHRFGRIVNLSSGLGQLEDMGDGTPAYRASKTALNALTRMVSEATRRDNILVNSLCPGWVRTDLGGSNAPRGVEKGAETAVWLATLPDGGPSGGFFRDKRRISW
jgi:NAD(P)-dependent dehydrogenase (short-subunit alcohol dehydrogenase family)